MKVLLRTILVSLLVSGLMLWGFLNMPLSWLGKPSFGASYTTVVSTDTVKNAILTNINSGINSLVVDVNNMVGSTTNTTLTTATNLTSIGALSSGSLTTGFTAVNVAQGGTGSTTLSQFNVLLGSSTNPVGIVNGLGSSGQALCSNGVGAAPTWCSLSFNTTQDYSLTGAWNLAGAATYIKALIASTTVTFSNAGAGYSIVFPSSLGASSTILATDASGNLTWEQQSILKVSGFQTGATLSTNNTGTTTLFTVTIPANTLRANALVKITALGTQTGTSNFQEFDVQFGNGSASSTIGTAQLNGAGNNQPMQLDIRMQMNGATNAETYVWSSTSYGDSTFNTRGPNSNALLSIDTTAQTYLSFRAKVLNGADTAIYRGITVEIIQ